MDDSVYEYETRQIPDSLLSQLESHLDKGPPQIDQENTPLREVLLNNLTWLLSFQAFIDQIDPQGENATGSLRGRWHAATYIFPRAKDQYISAEDLQLYIANGRAILDGLLLTRTARVVSRRKNLDQSSRYFLHKRDLPVQDNFVFVLMPFGESWSDYIWQRQIKPIVESISSYPLVCKRADDLFGQDILRDIYESILAARIIIADITNRNANVFYELGLAHSIGKDVILLSQGSDHIPFDLNRFRHILYSNDGPGYDDLQTKIPRMLETILAES